MLSALLCEHMEIEYKILNLPWPSAILQLNVYNSVINFKY